MSIAVFGGSFDPLHIGHEAIIRKLLEIDINRLIIVPAFLNPLKSAMRFSDSLRLEWIRILIANISDRIECSDYEIMQQKPTPTIRTIEHIIAKYNDNKIYLAIGADNLSSLHRWVEIDRLKNLVEFIVFARGDSISQVSGLRLQYVDFDMPISSSDIMNDFYGLRDYIPVCLRDLVSHAYNDIITKRSNYAAK